MKLKLPLQLPFDLRDPGPEIFGSLFSIQATTRPAAILPSTIRPRALGSPRDTATA